MEKTYNKNKLVALLVGALLLVSFGGILFMGAVSGWFDGDKVTIDAEYYCGEDCVDGGHLADLASEQYEELMQNRKSFLILIDQNGCTTADRLREYAEKYAEEKGLIIYRMMFGEMKKTKLNDTIKYYPSVAIVDKGKIKAFLNADNNEDADIYNNYDDFLNWMNKYLLG